MAALDIVEKLSLLSGAAKYDASCATGEGAGLEKTAGGTAMVYHSFTESGRPVRLLKVLFSNVCRFDCAYCVNRASSGIQRASFTARELAGLCSSLWRKRYIDGFFLSSGVFADPDIVMGKLIETVKLLRKEAGYNGYIHLKIIPGAGEKLIREAGLWADRLSINIELPTDKSLQTLAPQKSGKTILEAMNDFTLVHSAFEEDRRRIRSTPEFAPAGQTTQLIVGASADDDRQIIALSSSLYRKFSLRRVYYSAFMPIHLPGGGGLPDPRLPDIPSPPLAREHRLYQADWLIRFYHFTGGEIFGEGESFLDGNLDPKTAWALRRLDFFPVEVNRACYEELLRVPGIGAKTARIILERRRSHTLDFEGLRRLGVILKRARYFITCSGTFLDRPEDPKRIRRLLSDSVGAGMQLPLFDF
ncbi:MAG: putative DNA modification/repair radical SAM protein [Treponema sp.]|jgi:putative DNA modification/repair radical SAM protein|nr:putative DNA modification/repair radical SAM protein [Treponema sp.]